MRRVIHRGLIAALSAALTACGSGADRRIAEGDEPMQALQVRHLSRRYNAEFWREQARVETAVWSIALQFCTTEGRDTNAHPNCAAVLRVRAEVRPPRGRTGENVTRVRLLAAARETASNGGARS